MGRDIDQRVGVHLERAGDVEQQGVRGDRREIFHVHVFSHVEHQFTQRRHVSVISRRRATRFSGHPLRNLCRSSPVGFTRDGAVALEIQVAGKVHRAR